MESKAGKFAEKNKYTLESHDEGGYLGIDEKEFARLLEEYKNLCFQEAINEVEGMLTDHSYVNVDAQCALKNVLEILKEEINGR